MHVSGEAGSMHPWFVEKKTWKKHEGCGENMGKRMLNNWKVKDVKPCMLQKKHMYLSQHIDLGKLMVNQIYYQDSQTVLV